MRMSTSPIPSHPSIDPVASTFLRALEEHKRRETEIHELRKALDSSRMSAVGQQPMNRSKMSHENSQVVEHSIQNPKNEPVSNEHETISSDRSATRQAQALAASERRQIENQVEEYHKLMTQRLMEVERDRDRALSQLAQRTEELALKDKQLHDSYKELARSKGVVERIRLEQSESAQEKEKQVASLRQQCEEEIRRLRQEHQQVASNNRNLHDICQHRSVELEQCQAQLEEWERKFHAWIEEKKALAEQAEDSWTEAQQLRAVVSQRDHLHQNYEEERAKLQRRVEHLEQVLRTVSDEHRSDEERTVALRVELDTLRQAHASSSESHTRTLKSMHEQSQRVFHETRRLLDEVDRTRDDLTELKHQGARGRSEGTHPHKASTVHPRTTRFDLPSEALNAGVSDTLLLDTLVRTEEILSITWEDVHALRLDTRHELMRAKDYHRQNLLLREALETEGIRKKEIVMHSEELEKEKTKLQTERTLLRSSLEEGEKWMEEAVTHAQGLNQRVDTLTVENKRLIALQAENHQAMVDLRNRTTELENELDVLKGRLEISHMETWKANERIARMDAQTRQQATTCHTLQEEVAMSHRNHTSSQEELVVLRERFARAEGESSALRRQCEEQASRLGSMEQARDQLSRDVRLVREELSSAQEELSRVQGVMRVNAETERHLRDTLREKETQLRILRRQRDDAEALRIQLKDDNDVLRSRLGGNESSRSKARNHAVPVHASQPEMVECHKEASTCEDRNARLELLETRVQSLLARREANLFEK